MNNQDQCAALSADEKANLLKALMSLDVSILRTGESKWKFAQEKVGDGYTDFSDESYDSENEAILAAAENWSL